MITNAFDPTTPAIIHPPVNPDAPAVDACIVTFSHQIERFVLEAGYRGQIDIDIFEIDGQYFISEVNPRFGGGYPHAFESGCNHMELILNNLNGVANRKNIGAYDEGIYMMKYNEVKIIK